MARPKKVDPKKLLAEEIAVFVKSMIGKARANQTEVNQMFALYNKWYGTMEQNYNCDLCAIRIYTKLEKIAKDYETGKRIR